MLVCAIVVHIYAALWIKGSVRAMTQGKVTYGWAYKHHRQWFRTSSGRERQGLRPCTRFKPGNSNSGYPWMAGWIRLRGRCPSGARPSRWRLCVREAVLRKRPHPCKLVAACAVLCTRRLGVLPNPPEACLGPMRLTPPQPDPPAFDGFLRSDGGADRWSTSNPGQRSGFFNQPMGSDPFSCGKRI